MCYTIKNDSVQGVYVISGDNSSNLKELYNSAVNAILSKNEDLFTKFFPEDELCESTRLSWKIQAQAKTRLYMAALGQILGEGTGTPDPEIVFHNLLNDRQAAFLVESAWQELERRNPITDSRFSNEKEYFNTIRKAVIDHVRFLADRKSDQSVTFGQTDTKLISHKM